MSNIVDFLETVGQNASLRYASNGEMQRMLADTRIDPEVRDAVLAKDQARLTALAGARNVCCMLVPAMVQSDRDSGTGEDDGYYHQRRA
ncbi:hypothetical protein RHOFW510R12_03800 [Rhodanobacter sp. FW510-R12]|uniref:hypothetical protein n=1 Tax=unclassified Rhodanobacter TaxID=2621553 RepID=UPI0007A9A85D|nr:MULTISPECIES: hypothetical protein [unclassified Rhodanobacter]KZC15833.1 hypothetical protein RHOFW104R8_02765 [Rhodanobacter sp. FW104-R8]KZC26147.1 hypothetical protein RhoFW510T8_03965 [Rhodanobacter sp. FW510-T8]KZC29946.1 hypothetical protein RhoFW510R10_03810 [Rhodanobacter sp. FW510-R10]